MVNKLIKIIYLAATFLIVNELTSLDDPLQFIDLSSLLIVAIPTLLAGGIGWLTSKSSALSCSFYTSIFSGVLGLIMGLVQTFSNSNGDATAIHVGISVALLPLFYGVSIGLFLLPFHIVGRK